MAAEVALEDLAPDRHRALALLALDVGPDARLGARRLHQLEPVLRRRLVRGGDDLDRVAALQLVAQRHELAVDARAGAVVPDLGVDAVGEVDHRGADGEVQQVALRREDEDLLAEEVLLHRAQELVRVGEVLLPLEHLAQPGEALVGVVRALACRAPCSASAPRCRTPPRGASRGCGSGSRCARRTGRSPSCAATGTRWSSAARCSP